ncbi:MAG: HAMP domain-containing histidine kinase [Clostridia bacterium]|nr:HAMP domain-containing histidine kinase [Clostridia bacterium]
MAKEKGVKKPKQRNYKKKQRSTSIYFLIWAAFSAVALVIVLIFGLSQHFTLVQTHKEEIERNLIQKGRQITASIAATATGVPPLSESEWHSYLRYLARVNDVGVLVLSESGEVLCPNDEYQKEESYAAVAKLIGKKLGDELGPIVFEGEEDYGYAVRFSYFGQDGYLYIYESMGILDDVTAQMVQKTVMTAIFVLLLTFAVSSGISGWLTRPITEMTEKAKLFAAGDFNVDFRGGDYGSEMVELADTLNFARDEISKADRMQKELIANVSHDFKTPLTMIKAYSSMIREISGENPEKRNKHAQVIIDEADRLTSLVEDLLDLSKLRAGINEVKPTTFDLSAYTYEVLERFEYLKETKGYDLRAEIEDGIFTFADEKKIGQVLYNLIGNAVNYTGEDKKVVVRVKKCSETEAYFAVTDTGEGIPEEELPTIWERYYRSAEMHKRPVKGTGLGLSIVRVILEMHRFKFGVKSELGKGSTFYVVFPLRKGE